MTRRDHRAFYPRHRRWLEPVIVAAVVLGAMLLMAAPGHCEEAPSRASRYAYYGALHGGDVLSTEVAQSRGGHESNPMPFMQSTTGRVVSKALGTVILAEADLYLTRKKHRKTKWFVRLVAGGAMGWVIHHNLQVERRVK